MRSLEMPGFRKVPKEAPRFSSDVLGEIRTFSQVGEELSCLQNGPGTLMGCCQCKPPREYLREGRSTEVRQLVHVVRRQ